MLFPTRLRSPMQRHTSSARLFMKIIKIKLLCYFLHFEWTEKFFSVKVGLNGDESDRRRNIHVRGKGLTGNRATDGFEN